MRISWSFFSFMNISQKNIDLAINAMIVAYLTDPRLPSSATICLMPSTQLVRLHIEFLITFMLQTVDLERENVMSHPSCIALARYMCNQELLPCQMLQQVKSYIADSLVVQVNEIQFRSLTALFK